MPQDRVEAVERALVLLGAFREPGERLSLADLAERSGFYKSTILRLMGSLGHFDFVVRDADGTYRIGPAAWQVGSRYRGGFGFDPTVRPVLTALRDTTGETASIYVRDGDARVVLYRENSSHAMRHHLDEGAHFPLRQGAAGKVLSAWSEPADPAFDAIRADGYARSLGERDPDIGALAVPLFGPGDTFRGALSLSGVVAHFGQDRAVKKMLTALRRAAKGLH